MEEEEEFERLFKRVAAAALDRGSLGTGEKERYEARGSRRERRRESIYAVRQRNDDEDNNN